MAKRISTERIAECGNAILAALALDALNLGELVIVCGHVYSPYTVEKAVRGVVSEGAITGRMVRRLVMTGYSTQERESFVYEIVPTQPRRTRRRAP